MRVLLIAANRETINMTTWPLGLMKIAAAARVAGHEVVALDLMQTADPRAAIADHISKLRPQAIGISVRNIDDQNYAAPRSLLEPVKAVLTQCRELSSAPIILGGAGFSIFPESALAYLGADFGVVGEGELIFPQLLARLERQESPADLPGVYCAGEELRNPPLWTPDLDSLPPTTPSLLDAGLPAAEDFWLPVQTRRGCPNRCIYCSTPMIEGPTLRKRSIPMVLDELKRWRQAGCRKVYFVDSIFNLPEAYAVELCHEIAAASLDLVWRGIVYPVQMSEELARSMAQARCVEAAIGFESGSATMLQRLDKGFTPADVRHTCELLTANRIRVVGFLLLGGPGETKQTVQESLEFAATLPLSMLKITIGLRIYPGSPLAAIAVAESLIDPADDLLTPVFYLASSLDPWIFDYVNSWIKDRPNWF